LSIDFILSLLSQHEISACYGKNLVPHLKNLSIIGFADDIVNISGSRSGARELVTTTIDHFHEIGLEVNPVKSKAIIIEKGVLNEEDLTINENLILPSLKQNEVLKYLGVSFTNEILLDEHKIFNMLKDNIQSLVSTTVLKPFQKLSILNTYVWPQLTYSLQTAPLHKISFNFLKDIDKLIRSSIKEILNIPNDTTTSFLYSPKEVKGLGLIRFEWEAFVQQLNISQKLLRGMNEYVKSSRNLSKEITICIEKLNLSHEVSEIPIGMYSSKHLRLCLRKKEFENWKQLPYKGKGVELFFEQPRYNRWFT